MPGREELPSTLERSSPEAQRTWIKAHDSAVEQYGEGERAHRVAYGALKHTHEKVGDHWERKEGGQGPLGPAVGQAARAGRAQRRGCRRERLQAASVRHRQAARDRRTVPDVQDGTARLDPQGEPLQDARRPSAVTRFTAGLGGIRPI